MAGYNLFYNVHRSIFSNAHMLALQARRPARGIATSVKLHRAQQAIPRLSTRYVAHS